MIYINHSVPLNEVPNGLSCHQVGQIRRITSSRNRFKAARVRGEMAFGWWELPLLPFRGCSSYVRKCIEYFESQKKERDGESESRGSPERELGSALPLGQVSSCTHFCGIRRGLVSSWGCQSDLPDICPLNIPKVHKCKGEVRSRPEH